MFEIGVYSAHYPFECGYFKNGLPVRKNAFQQAVNALFTAVNEVLARDCENECTEYDIFTSDGFYATFDENGQLYAHFPEENLFSI